jgi:hypothetical protein
VADGLHQKRGHTAAAGAGVGEIDNNRALAFFLPLLPNIEGRVAIVLELAR